MANIEIVIQETGKEPRKSIHPQEALKDFQRVWKNELIDYYLVDEKGNKIQGNVKTVSDDPRKKAFEALQERAKKLKIKGWHLMAEDKLLKSVQEASNK